MNKSIKEIYDGLYQAYHFFNEKMFDGKLPIPLITLEKMKKARGAFQASQFVGNNDVVHEITMNPSDFGNREPRLILSTLVHEMTHLWQEEFGENKPTKATHNREWADEMDSFGLVPSSTGEEGGKRTGKKMNHYIVEGGLFSDVCADFLEKGDPIFLQYVVPLDEKEKKEKEKTKFKFECPTCGQQIWGKKDANTLCGACYSANGEVVELLIEEDGGGA